MISIITHYSPSDGTYAALRVADIALMCGEEVRVIAADTPAKQVDPFWDNQRVNNTNDRGLDDAIESRVVVHFHFSRTDLEFFRSCRRENSDSRKHILVPNWHSLARRDIPLAQEYDQIICSSLAGYQAAQSILGDDKPARLDWCRWDAGFPYVERDRPVTPGRVRACFLCDRAVIDYCAPLTLQLIDELLLSIERLDIDVLTAGSWSKSDYRRLKTMQKQYGARLAARTFGNFAEVHKELHRHDWAVVPGVRSSFGTLALRAMACGAAVVAYDCPPFSELLRRDRDILVPCEIRTNELHAPTAVPSLGCWIDACRRSFASPRTFFPPSTLLQERKKAFVSFWRQLLTM